MARLYLDENLGKSLAVPLRALGHDVLTTQEAGRFGTSDPAQLDFAAHENRVLVTYNRDDFGGLHDRLVTHAGIISLSTKVGEVPATIDRIARLHEPMKDKHIRLNGGSYDIDTKHRLREKHLYVPLTGRYKKPEHKP